MNDFPKILAGLAIFLILALFPFLYSSAFGSSSNEAPLLTLPEGEKECVESKEFMNAWHMDMLDDWRNSAIRDGNRVFEASNGKKYEKSLSRTCMKCHSNKEQFCDKCHDYTGVTPYCWDCHVEP